MAFLPISDGFVSWEKKYFLLVFVFVFVLDIKISSSSTQFSKRANFLSRDHKLRAN